MTIKKQFWLILLLFSLALGGCALVEGEEGVHREPLNVADWPTPAPAVVTVTPTPFPKTTLPPTPPPQVLAETASGVEAVAANPEVAKVLQQLVATDPDLAPLLEEWNAGGDLTSILQQLQASGKGPELMQQLLASGQASELLGQPGTGDEVEALLGAATQAPGTGGLGGLTPLAVSNIRTETAELRQRPDPAAAVVDRLEQGDLAGILGRDAGGNWLFVITINNSRGWLPVDTMRVVGDLSGIPTLPPGILATLSQPASTGNNTPPASAAAAPPAQPLDLSSLKPVASATVNASLVNMRQRPGPDFPVVGTVAEAETLQLLALNERGDWALVTTAQGNSGWIWLKNLAVKGSLENAPRLKTTEAQAGQPAPLLPAGSSPAVPEAAVFPPASGNAPLPVAVNNSGPALPANTLASVATATINTKVDGRRGPGSIQGGVTTFTVDEKVTVHGTNAAGDWVIVQGPNSRIGWIPLSSLNLASPLTGAPAVVTAWVESNEIEVKAGPGIYYETSGVLPINNMVSIIALNEGRSWALIESFAGGRGWVPLRFLANAGSLSGVPEIAAPAVAETSPPLFPAGPAPLTGKLVFQTSSGGDIMLINSDGTGLRRLTSGIDPVLSPDGRQVAFTRWSGDTGTLWTINVDGTNERAVLGEMRKAKGPDWSPDGSQIILNFQQGGYVDEQRECVPLRPGSFPRLPRNATDIGVVVDSEGNVKLCFTLPPDPHWTLRLVNLNDSSFKDLYGGLYAFRPAWDPAQPWRVVSDAGNGLLAVDLNRDDYRQYLTEELLDGSPAFSPDGRFIATATANQGGYDLYRLNADGSGRIRLTETPLWVPVQPENEGKVWNNVAPTWSPDSSQIAFLTDREGRWEIWVMSADGSNQRPMFSPEINEQLTIEYNFVDERVLSWR